MEMRDMQRNVPNEVNCWVEIIRSVLKIKSARRILTPKHS